MYRFLLLSLVFFFSGCVGPGRQSTNTEATTHQTRTSAYQLVITTETREDRCHTRTLRFEARGGLHSRPHVNRAIAKDRDCDMTIDHVRIPRNPDRRMYRAQQHQIDRDFQRAYYKALTQ